MVVLMILSLVLAAAIPRAFEDRALPFAVAYVALQVLRSAFMVGAFPRGSRMRRSSAYTYAHAVLVAGVIVEGIHAPTEAAGVGVTAFGVGAALGPDGLSDA